MRSILGIIYFLISFYSNAQMRDIRLVNGNEVKVDLSLINDTLAYISFEEFGYDQYLLGKYAIDRDTIKFTELFDFLDIKSDIFYSVNNEIPKGQIEIQSRYNHLFLRGKSIYNSLTYRIDGVEYLTKQDDPLHTSIVNNLVLNPFNIELYNGGIYIGVVGANIPEGMNVIQIRTIELYSIYDYSYDLDKLLPKKLKIDNYEYHLKVNLR